MPVNLYRSGSEDKISDSRSSKMSRILQCLHHYAAINILLRYKFKHDNFIRKVYFRG